MLRKIFGFSSDNSLRLELLGGFTTFMTMSYIVFVNSAILSDAGLEKTGLLTVTALACFLCTMISAVWIKSPICFAPGMGLNTIFVVTLVGVNGLSAYGALGVVFMASLVFLIFSICGLCEQIIDSIPDMLKASISIGIGLFITHIGFNGLGFADVIDGESYIVPICGLAGLIVILLLDLLQVKGSILAGIVFATAVSVFLGVNSLPDNYISFPPPNISQTFFNLDIASAFDLKSLPAVISLAIVEILGITGTIISCNSASNKGLNLDNKKVFITDSVSGILGSLLGTSTMTGYIESAAGIKEGARTGESSAVCAVLFLSMLCVIPLIQIVPDYATAPALIMVGVIMLKDIKMIKLSKFNESIPSLLTIISMPLTGDISVGMSFGFVSFVLINCLVGKYKEVSFVIWIVGVLSIFNLVTFFC